MQNYDRIIEKISKISNIEKEEIGRRIEAKRAKLSGLISKEGAAQVVAAELGISFDNEVLKIEELLPGMRKVNTFGKVIGVSPIRTFKTKKGDEGKVVNLFVADDTSNVKVVLWDTNHIDLIENGKVGEGVVIEISNGSMRDNELHLGSFSEIKLSDKTFDDVKTEKVVRKKNIIDFKVGDSSSVRAFVVQNFPPRFFEVNKETGKKISEEEKSQGIAFEKRALINIVLDDGTENIRAVLFHENLSKLGLKDLEDAEKLNSQRDDLLGKEFTFSGNVRTNKFFNNTEFIIDAVEEIDSDLLIKELEGN